MILQSFETILLSFLGFLSCCCFWGRPSDQYLCHDLESSPRELPNVPCEALCGALPAAEAADAALLAFRMQRSLVLLLCLDALVVKSNGLPPMRKESVFLVERPSERLHHMRGEGGLAPSNTGMLDVSLATEHGSTASSAYFCLRRT